jgi:signal transduction histidine kinase
VPRGVPRTGDASTPGLGDAVALTGGDNRRMDSAERPLAPVALAAAFGLLVVAELAARLTYGSTVRAGLASGSLTHAAHTGASLPTALLMAAFCLLATGPAGLRRPVLAAVAVWVAALASLLLFDLVTAGGAAALVMASYRLARAGSRVLAVALTVPFLGLALGLAATASRVSLVNGGPRDLAGGGIETYVLAVLLASAIPVAVVAAIARGAREEDRSHSATRELAEGMLADHLARGERARIARELHDVVAHHISVIAVQAKTARLTTPGLPDAGADRFAAIGDTARAGLTEMRRLLGVLREDAHLAEPDLPSPPPRPAAERQPQPGLPQLGELIDEARAASGSVVRFIVSGPVARLDPGVELAAYRIVQEALTNVRRHAAGAAVDVELRYAGDVLRLRIRDNGPGLAARHTGHGLLGMRERAAAVGGSLQTGPAPGGGFRIEAELPAQALDTVASAPIGARE